MPQISILIKPVSGLCNLNCKYCFYNDEMAKRTTKSYGLMTLDTLEHVIHKTFSFAEKHVSIAFQGGEPTLAGIVFYKKCVELVEQYNTRKLPVSYAIQTNGYLLDKEWCVFLKQNHFLVGLSIDGIKQTHDAYRKTLADEDTYFKVLDTARLLEKEGVPFNVLTVIHKKTALKINKIYENYRKQLFQWQQYIICLEPYEEKRGARDYSLTPTVYGQFLVELFRLWKEDLCTGKQPFIRQFENYLAILTGRIPESCDQKGICSIQNVIEADGSVFPCDFYVMDKYYLGNLTKNSFSDIYKRREEIQFIEASMQHPAECVACKWFALCRTGCRRQREVIDNLYGKSYFCEGYKYFFNETYKEWMELVRHIV